MIHRYKTDTNCPRPTVAEVRSSAGRFSLWVVISILVVLALSAFLSSRAEAALANTYWRVDLHQGTGIIAYGQGSTSQAAWDDCVKLQALTRAMSATETRKAAVAAITTSVVRWCQNPRVYATVSKDPVPVSGTAALFWQHTTPPAIAGFRIVHGTDPAALVSTIQLPDATLRTYVVTNLPAGPRYFAMKAYDSTGVESPLSQVVSKVIP